MALLPENAIYIFIGITIAGRIISGKHRISKQSLETIKEILCDWTAILMIIVGVCAFVSPLFELINNVNHLVSVISVIMGGIIIGIGFILLFYANKEISSNWSPSIKKTEDQQLAKNGVYQLIRHPLYLGGIIILVGMNIFFESKLSWIYVFVCILSIHFRITKEEEKLEEYFGLEFRKYKEKSSRLIPGIY